MNRSRITRCLTVGLIGAAVTITGEMLQGLAKTMPASTSMLTLFETCARLPVWRIGLGSTVGAIGILLQYFGLYGVFLSLKTRDDQAANAFRLGMYNYSFAGAVIHILLSVMIYVYKLKPEAAVPFTLWFALPFLLVFLAGYGWFSIVLFKQFRRGETLFPAWCCVLNPLLGKGLLNALAALLPPSAFANGIRYSNMGLTALVMFGALLVVHTTGSTPE